MNSQELNSYLIEKYNFGLHPFAIILAYALNWLDNPRREYPQSAIDLKDVKKNLFNLKRKIIKTICDYEALFGNDKLRIMYKKNSEEIEKYIIHKKPGLSDFFNSIDGDVRYLNSIIEKKHPGAPRKKRNLITSSWALLIREHKNQIDWALFADILDWFRKRFQFYKYYKGQLLFRNISNPQNLKNQFYRYKEKAFAIFDSIKHKYFKKGLSRIEYCVNFSTIDCQIIEVSNFQDTKKNYETYKNFLDQHTPLYEEVLSEKKDYPEVSFEEIMNALDYHFWKCFKINSLSSPPSIIFPDLSYLQ